MGERDDRREGPAQAPGAQGAAQAGHLAFVIHEARNPISTALLCSELLGRLSPEDRAGPRGVRLAEQAQRSVRRLSRLLEDHFLTERLRCGGYPLRPAPIRLAEALGTAAAQAGVAERLELVGCAGRELLAEGPLLDRALEALLAAAGRDEAAVRVEAAEEEGLLRLRFAGAPQPAGALERPSRGAPSEGRGRDLGLSLAGELARAHGGDLRLEEGELLLRWPRAPSGPGGRP